MFIGSSAVCTTPMAIYCLNHWCTYYSNMHVNFFFPFVRCLFGFKVIMSPVSICCVARALLFAGCSLLTGDAVLNIPATVWKVINIMNQTVLLKKRQLFCFFPASHWPCKVPSTLAKYIHSKMCTDRDMPHRSSLDISQRGCG